MCVFLGVETSVVYCVRWSLSDSLFVVVAVAAAVVVEHMFWLT